MSNVYVHTAITAILCAALNRGGAWAYIGLGYLWTMTALAMAICSIVTISMAATGQSQTRKHVGSDKGLYILGAIRIGIVSFFGYNELSIFMLLSTLWQYALSAACNYDRSRKA